MHLTSRSLSKCNAYAASSSNFYFSNRCFFIHAFQDFFNNCLLQFVFLLLLLPVRKNIVFYVYYKNILYLYFFLIISNRTTRAKKNYPCFSFMINVDFFKFRVFFAIRVKFAQGEIKRKVRVR
jgi:hypothetical protein